MNCLRLPLIWINALAVAYVMIILLALLLSRSDKKAEIDVYTCIGCGACIPICPFKAISLVGKKPDKWDELWLGKHTNSRSRRARHYNCRKDYS